MASDSTQNWTLSWCRPKGLDGSGAINLYGENGDDTISGSGDARSVLDGGDGNDLIEDLFGPGGNKIYGRGGNDTIYASTPLSSGSMAGAISPDTIYGGDGNDKIIVSGFHYKFSGLVSGDAGNDTISATQADHANINGGAGIDNITLTTATNSVIQGGDGQDYMNITDVHNSTLNGGADNDTIIGDILSSNNTINGADGNDEIQVSANNSVVSGGNGDDDIHIAATSSGKVNGDAGNDTISLFEQGSEGGHIINGGAGNDSITTMAPEVSVVSHSGNGSILGSGHQDVLKTDTIYGGDGNDTIFSKDNDVVSAGTGDDFVRVGSHYAGITWTKGGSNIALGDGNDTALGGNNGDSISGGNGNDSIAGDAGADTLRGDQGNDTINGGAGADVLYGGADADVFVFKAMDGNDTINDFNVSEDKLFLSNDTLHAGVIAPQDVHLIDGVVAGVRGVTVQYTTHFGGGNGSLAGSTHTDSVFVRGATAATISHDLLFS